MTDRKGRHPRHLVSESGGQSGRNTGVMRMHRVRRSAVMSVLLVVGMLSIAVGSASAAGWLAPQNVPLSVSDLGFDEDGNAIAVGVGADSSGAASFRSMVRPFGGQWSASLPVSGIGDSDVRWPQVAVDPQGNAVAVWSAENQGATKRVIRASSRPAGGKWSEPVMISERRGVPGDHDVVIDAQGNATAIWSEFVHRRGFVVRAANRPSGGDWSDPVDLSESAVEQPAAAGGRSAGHRHRRLARNRTTSAAPASSTSCGPTPPGRRRVELRRSRSPPRPEPPARSFRRSPSTRRATRPRSGARTPAAAATSRRRHDERPGATGVRRAISATAKPRKWRSIRRATRPPIWELSAPSTRSCSPAAARPRGHGATRPPWRPATTLTTWDIRGSRPIRRAT